MSTLTITVPQDYGYVVLAATGALTLGIWHAVRVGSFRRAAGIPYPYPYYMPASDDYRAESTAPQAHEKYLFNCAQRGHANYLENLPLFLPALAVSGLKYPRFAAGAGLVWSISRIAYSVGYTNPKNKKGEGRVAGSAISTITQVILLGTSIKIAIDLIQKS